ncbi:alpha/beta hydrolase family esterase [Streptomyces sp. NPDC102462]|uniref:alpha/beta hydrolase family esterase n=1 Tax=Streptomyces sp. NPDC102462 TaxID=3366178 RepID=UPI003826B6AD
MAAHLSPHLAHRLPARTASRHRPGRRRWYGASALALVLALTGCGTAADRDAERPTRPATATATASATATATTRAPLTRERLRVDGRTRAYLLHRPAEGGDGRRPLVIAFHGRGASAAEMREQSRLEEDARARGTLVAYPEGLRAAWGAGTQVTRQRPDVDADVRFAEALIGDLVRTERADPHRVYAVGFSNGGSMALRLAAQRPGLLAGTASVSGQLPSGAAAVRPTGPVPVLIVYGADDPVRPLAGLPHPAPAPAGEEPVTPTLSARASAEAFAKANKAGRPVTESEKGFDRTVWRPGPAGDDVRLVVVHGAGHSWPGSSLTPPKGFGATSTALSATRTVLDFFTPAHR